MCTLTEKFYFILLIYFCTCEVMQMKAFTAALFVIAKDWILPKCPLRGNGKINYVHLHCRMLCSH